MYSRWMKEGRFSVSLVSLDDPAKWTVTLLVLGTVQEETVKVSGKQLLGAGGRPQVCFSGAAESVLRCRLRRKAAAFEFDVPLEALPRGCDFQLKRSFPLITVVLELCAFDFGAEQAAEEGDEAVPVRERNPLLVSMVLDGAVYELRDVRGPKALSDVEVAAQHASAPLFRSSGSYSLRPGAPTLLHGEDFTFFLDPFERTVAVAVRDKKGEDVLGAAVALDERRLAARKPRAFWVELSGGEGAAWHAWARVRLQITEEGAPESFLARYGEPVHTLPFRVSFGDVVLFDDPGLSANLVSLSTGSKYDHIGIVVPAPPHDKRNVLEASRRGCFGIPIDERLRSALGAGARVAVRRLVGVERSEWCKNVLRGFLDTHEGKGYEKMSTIVRSRFRANSHEDKELNQLFCSELVARALMDLNALDSGNRLASNYLPSDFAQPSVPGESMPHMFEPLKLHRNGGRRRARSRAASMEVRSQEQVLPGGGGAAATAVAAERTSSSSPRSIRSPRRSGARATVAGLLSPLSPKKKTAHKRGKSLGVEPHKDAVGDELV